nr:Chain M, Fusion protein consisting of transforming protein p21b and Ras related protein Rap-2b [Homo sapiens]1N4P_N Chain N, Fusion protein consisting of transforming protein p21b and Ras related protein Rap-2b [Homo sapiens]1N4Q_M Chain M, Fusion protein consisting of transforming protein p21b and Ras related protein Rap-2b [Homo sapiens]1N4Q_N Chain N, Fusion protein consisting of transforming protein p21b and Ras related protein Rap-2b [Homo sapiens]1N4Q_O Chain O, Fusion protein consisti
KKKSKTKCVIL